MDNKRRDRTTAEALQECSQALNQLLLEMTRPLHKPLAALDATLNRIDERCLRIMSRVIDVWWQTLIVTWIVVGIVVTVAIVMQ